MVGEKQEKKLENKKHTEPERMHIFVPQAREKPDAHVCLCLVVHQKIFARRLRDTSFSHVLQKCMDELYFVRSSEVKGSLDL